MLAKWPHVPRETAKELGHGALRLQRHLVQGVDYCGLIMVEQDPQVLRRVRNMDSPWRKGRRPKVTNVERHNRFRLPVDRCRENMSILRVVLTTLLEVFESLDHGFGKVLGRGADAGFGDSLIPSKAVDLRSASFNPDGH